MCHRLLTPLLTATGNLPVPLPFAGHFTYFVFFSVRTKESLCRVGTADLSEQQNGESRERASSSRIGRSLKDISGHAQGCFAMSLTCDCLALAKIKEKRSGP